MMKKRIRAMRPGGIRAWMVVAALLAGVCGLRAEQPYYEAALKIEPVGSNPSANKMDRKAFDSYTAEVRSQFQRFAKSYSPDYADSQWMLGPPREGRLSAPLPLARKGVAAAEIIVDLDPALHTPEATLGRTNYPAEVIPMRKTGHLIVRHAAEELKLWLDALTGADFPIRGKATDAQTHIFVGASFAKSLFPADLEQLGQGECLDGYSVRAKGSDLYIFGATAKGALNGVYAFLENNSDLIWAHSFSDLGTVYTVNPELSVVWAGGVDKPQTVQRGWLGHYEETAAGPGAPWLWQMRNRSNFIVAPGPSPRMAEWGCWLEGGGHCLGTFAPLRDKDFFPLMVDPVTGKAEKPDKIVYNKHNLCLTHPDLPGLYAEKMVELFRSDKDKNPDAPLNAFRLGVEDPGPEREYGVCQCPRCLKPIKLPDGRIIPYQNARKEGLAFRSTQLYLLLEPIARAVLKENPEARFSTYAYYFAAEPPPFQVSVQPWLCPYGGGGQLVHRDYRHPLFWETNAKWWNFAYGWSRITDLTVLRDYNGLITNGRPFADVLAWDVRALLPLGVKRFANETALQTAFMQMDFWVASRLYWNPDADVEQLEKYYVRRTFREGAPEMEKFFGEIRKWWFGTFEGREDFVNLGWMIDKMGGQRMLYGHLQEAYKLARHPMARANIARLLKTFEHWFHLNLEDGTADAMLASAKLGRHVRYSSFMQGEAPMTVTYMTLSNDAPRESEALVPAGAAPKGGFKGGTFRLRIKPVGRAAKEAFPPPSLSVGSMPSPTASMDNEGGGEDTWSPPVAPERQKDGSYLYVIRLLPAKGSAFNPEKLSDIRFSYPLMAWPDPRGYLPEFAVYDMQLTDSAGKRYVDPGLAARQGSLPRKHYFEGGELGDE